MYQKRLVSAEEGFCFPDSASRIEQAVTFVTDMDGQSEILVCPKKIKDLFTEMMNVDHQFVESCRFQFQDYVLQHGASGHGHQCLGHMVGERFQAGSETRRKDHGFHE